MQLQLQVVYDLSTTHYPHIDARLAGTAFKIQRPGFDVICQFPPRDRRYPNSFQPYRGSTGEREDPITLVVAALEAVVQFEEPATDEMEAKVLEAESIAMEVVMHIRSWFRLHQPWIGLAEEIPQIVSPSAVVSETTGEWRKDIPTVGLIPLVGIVSDHAVSEEEFRNILANYERRVSPDVADSFLADARYLAHWVHIPVTKQAVLLAALACELKAKATIRALVSPESRALLDLMLARYRAFPLSAKELFDEVPSAIANLSLRSEDAGLYKKIDALFVKRNAVAHHGYVPTTDEAKDLVKAATNAFAWLRTKAAQHASDRV